MEFLLTDSIFRATNKHAADKKNRTINNECKTKEQRNE